MFFDTPSVPALLGSIIPFLVLDVVVVMLRFYTRRRLRQPLQADDWLMVPALTGVIALASMFFYGIAVKALGYRWYALPPPGTDMDTWVPVPAEADGLRIMLTRRLEYCTLLLHPVFNGLIKISVLLFYRRIFVVVPHWKDKRNLFFIAMITVIAMWAASFTFAFIFMCRKDVQVLFQAPELLMLKCVDTFKVGYSHSISDFVTDAIIVLIPIPFIWRLHLPTGRKFTVMGVFLLGIVASGASLVRLAWMAWNQSVGFGDSTDEELMITTEVYWMNLEITLGLIAACLPTLRGLLKTKSVDSMVKGVRSLFSIGSGSRSGSFGDSFRSKEAVNMDSYKENQILVHVDSRISGSTRAEDRV